LGLYFYRARWYDPALGRFTQPDTIVPKPENPQAYNRYSYVYNNPLRYVDPTGHFSDEELFAYFGVTSLDELRALFGWDEDWVSMLRSTEARLGSILVGTIKGQRVEAMFVTTEDGRLTLWNVGAKQEMDLWKFHGKASDWALFESKEEKGFGNYTTTRWMKNRKSAPEAPVLPSGWNEGTTHTVVFHQNYSSTELMVDIGGMVLGAAGVVQGILSGDVGTMGIGAGAFFVSLYHLVTGGPVESVTPVLTISPTSPTIECTCCPYCP